MVIGKHMQQALVVEVELKDGIATGTKAANCYLNILQSERKLLILSASWDDAWFVSL